MLTGRGCYVDDVTVSGMLHAAFARSDLARARIVGLDISAAQRAPGVHAVLIAADLNPLLAGPMGATPVLDHGMVGPQYVLAQDEVRFVGDPYAMVVATTRALAEDAAELIEMDFEPLVPVLDYRTALEGSELVHTDRGTNLAGEMVIPVDDELRRISDTAPHVVTGTFEQNRYHPVPMETRGIVAWWNRPGATFEVWVSTQSPHDVRTVTSRITGVPEGRVRVRMGDVGGGFGQKAYLLRDEQIVLLASYRLGRPIKWIEDRRENLIGASSARLDLCTVTLAADDDGGLLGMDVEHLDDVGAYPVAGSAAAMAAMFFTGPYRIPKFAMTTRSVYTNTCPRSPYRGPWQVETYRAGAGGRSAGAPHGPRPARATPPQRHPPA